MKIQYTLLICMTNVLCASIETKLNETSVKQHWDFKESTNHSLNTRQLIGEPESQKQSFFREIGMSEMLNNEPVQVWFRSRYDRTFYKQELPQQFEVSREQILALKSMPDDESDKCDYIFLTPSSNSELAKFLCVLCTKDIWLTENQDNVLKIFLEFYEKIKTK